MLRIHGVAIKMMKRSLGWLTGLMGLMGTCRWVKGVEGGRGVDRWSLVPSTWLLDTIQVLKELWPVLSIGGDGCQRVLPQVLASSKEGIPKGTGASVAPVTAKGKSDAAARLAVLKARLFRAVCRRVSRSLLNRDRLLFALRLAQVMPWLSSASPLLLALGYS